MEKIDVLIIGAGVVGLAIARTLAQSGREVLVLERENSAGSVTSARNSGVMHAGVYYKNGSLKAQLCVAGRTAMETYAKERGIPHKICGKLIVATHDQDIPRLKAFAENAAKNGVENIRLLTADEAKQFEPEVFCVGALHVPQTGIIDAHEYRMALEGDAENAGALLALRCHATKTRQEQGGFVVRVEGDAPDEIFCTTLINAAGLSAQEFARGIEGFAPEHIPPQVLAKGNYFNLPGKPPFSMLVYPLPTEGSSGLHAFCDMGGQMRFGPDVEWVDKIDYRVDASRRPAFEEAVRQYWPNLPPDVLQPDYCGIRPKIGRASPHNSDFVIQSAKQHGLPGLINLFGIESPGLTASLALGDYVAALTEKQNA